MLTALVAAQRAARRASSNTILHGCKQIISAEVSAAEGSSIKSAEVARAGSSFSTSASRTAIQQQQEALSGGSAPPGTGAEPAPQQQSSAVSRILSYVGNTLLAGFLASGAALAYYQFRYDCNEIEQLVLQSRQQQGSFPSQLWADLLAAYAAQRAQFESEVKKYSDPPSDHLLPDLPPQVRHVRTLVLDLDDTLVHSDWTRGRGWRTFKRPGTDDFLQQLVAHFELVVYTSQLPTYADPILDRLDPNHFIQFRLYRDSTRYINGRHVRDLSMLNRDLNKVLLVTTDTHAAALQPDNAVKIKPWKLEAEDTVLLDLLPFLEAVWSTNVPDVRDVVRSYQGQDIPTAYRDRMHQLQEANKQQKHGRKGFLGSFTR
ncbi:hypothetical protein WJX73_005759 [Symbiochloris irregularis]|uniref:Mitochondrial import inner membrane translocase subunit TIM50 n=1 Tax=Symbiochloris irregularis TaxID=706552 RepID=A0AAW1PMK1_9CHLO